MAVIENDTRRIQNFETRRHRFAAGFVHDTGN